MLDNLNRRPLHNLKQHFSRHWFVIVHKSNDLFKDTETHHSNDKCFDEIWQDRIFLYFICYRYSEYLEFTHNLYVFIEK